MKKSFLHLYIILIQQACKRLCTPITTFHCQVALNSPQVLHTLLQKGHIPAILLLQHIPIVHIYLVPSLQHIVVVLMQYHTVFILQPHSMLPVDHLHHIPLSQNYSRLTIQTSMSAVFLVSPVNVSAHSHFYLFSYLSPLFCSCLSLLFSLCPMLYLYFPFSLSSSPPPHLFECD